MKLKVTAEGRPGVYIPGRENLKKFIKSRKLEIIHNIILSGAMILGADHDVDSVLRDIDGSKRMAVLTGEAARGNMNYALSLILEDERGEHLEIYDIGKITDDDLQITTPAAASSASEGER